MVNGPGNGDSPDLTENLFGINKSKRSSGLGGAVIVDCRSNQRYLGFRALGVCIFKIL